ncbi:MAG TPA: alpha-hydroxy acid oxidase [Acidimicrobiales bacterium]|nr:alpha-hydroxy acid oxidase [Acidimicrobiales bacterium]
MKPSEIFKFVHVGRPPAPYGVRALARCYDIDDLARLARRRLPAGAVGYLDGGGEDEWTLKRNREAFGEVELLPRVLRNVRDVDSSTTILGTRVPLPFALSPVGGPRMIQYEGELAVARAAGVAGIPYGVSTLATQTVEDIRSAAGTGPLWFQLYLWGDRSVARELLRRARDAGYDALFVSADTTVRSERDRELHRGIELPTPELTIPTLLDGARHPRWSWHFLTSPAIGFPNLSPDVQRSHDLFKEMFDGTVCWDDFEWIRREWPGPIALKGVLRAEEARRAADVGLDAVVVSNHGGRQMDHVPAALEALPDVVDAVDGRIEVLFDSGIRRGSDIVTALSLGARAVLVGRAHLYGLAAAGEAGVRHAIDILSREVRMAMALSGARRVDELGRDLLRVSGPPAIDGRHPSTGEAATQVARRRISPPSASGTPSAGEARQP